MKTLIVYFSWSGNTDRLIRETNRVFDFPVVKIERKEPYSTDYNTCAYVEAKGEWQTHTYPEIKELGVNFAIYDRILLFYPIWWYTFPMPVATLIQKLKGYRGEIIVFENSHTFDPQYIDNSIKDLCEIDNSLNVRQGLFNKSASEHIEFIKNLDK